jgi:hypothetical protein
MSTCSTDEILNLLLTLIVCTFSRILVKTVVPDKPRDSGTQGQ